MMIDEKMTQIEAGPNQNRAGRGRGVINSNRSAQLELILFAENHIEGTAEPITSARDVYICIFI